ncbi:ribonuclease HIII [Cytobacillus oceanisediminis]|uniref:Ribonuclease n=1 Tax=Cytobacillus oceanisediminis TaxID=665099 RepID=A0A2V2ZRE8_9BACI|nr:ribonuclease HIII [Cytobacillus oceanisediminis]PWW26625.1 ribonuclease HIII [Cytobacillus oceanisediminis]
MNAKTKYEYLENFKGLLLPKGFTITDIKEINYGLQFTIKMNQLSGLVRIYESKKGVRHDFSQVKSSELLNMLENHLHISTQVSGKDKEIPKKENTGMSRLPDELIGTDESGKGDYFGPLVIAGVLVSKSSADILKELGITDSKKMSDKTIFELAPKIKELCTYAIVPIGNQKYNELYNKIQNLNRLLAWGHARVIENILTTHNCETVLSDQFGDETLIQKALLEKGKNIKLYQMPRAEQNIAVAAASVLARNEYVMRLSQIERQYKLKLPKGASTATQNSAKAFLKQYGKDELLNVAKLHFKTTQQILG